MNVHECSSTQIWHLFGFDTHPYTCRKPPASTRGEDATCLAAFTVAGTILGGRGKGARFFPKKKGFLWSYDVIYMGVSWFSPKKLDFLYPPVIMACWQKQHLWMTFPWKPPFTRDFPLPCLITRRYAKIRRMTHISAAICGPKTLTLGFPHYAKLITAIERTEFCELLA